MNYQNLVGDFARRTRINLETIRTFQKAKPDPQVYEVTQLINSMLGLLILPPHRFIESVPQKSVLQALP